MKGTYNPCDAGKGMIGLLIQHAYGPKSNKAVTLEVVLKEAKEAAAKESKATGTTVTPAFTFHSEAQEEVDRRNVAAQAMIGAKRRHCRGSHSPCGNQHHQQHAAYQ